MNKRLEKKIRKLVKLGQKYNPLENEADLKFVKMDWKIKPDLDLEETEYEVSFNKNIKGDDIKIKVEIDGEATVFTSGIDKDNLEITPELFGETIGESMKLKWFAKTNLKKEDSAQDILEKTTFGFNFEQNLTNKDVKFFIDFNGNGMVFTSPPGSNNLKATFGIKAKF